MRAFLKLWLLLLVTALTSSCTVYKEPVSHTHIDINTGIRAGGNIDIRLPPTVAVANDNAEKLRRAMSDTEEPPKVTESITNTVKPVTIEVCNRFTPPVQAPVPKMSDKQIDEASKASNEKYTELLLLQIRKMYVHSRNAQAANAEAMEKHLKTCRMITLP